MAAVGLASRWLARVVVLTLACGEVLAFSTQAASAAGGKPLKIVLIGDSYSAGNGARNDSGDRSYYGPEDCYRSNEGWAGRYVRWLRDQGFNVTLVNWACSGAVSDNLLNDRRMGSDRKLLFADGSVDTEAEARAEIDKQNDCEPKDPGSGEFFRITELDIVSPGQWVYTCGRFMRRQVDVLGQDTDLVLFSIGGNDIGFADIVAQCFALGLRDVDGCREKVDNARTLTNDALPSRLDNVFQAIRGRIRPDARVGYLSYPQLEKSDDYSLKKFGVFSEYKAGREIRQLGLLGEQRQREAVGRANAAIGARVTFVDTIKDHFDGPPSHEPDGSPYFENEDRWVAEFDGRIRFEWYHYNAKGHPEVKRLLEAYGSFGLTGSSGGSIPGVDLVFAIDTTGSMGDDIDAVKRTANELVNLVASRSSSARFGLVTYKDHPSAGGDSSDYPSRIELPFTSTASAAVSAINALSVSGGGDTPESVYSGVEGAIGMPWRPGVRKVVLVLGDAPAKDPEPITGYTAARVVADALAVDPAEVHVVEVGGTGSTGLASVAERTGGSIRTATTAADVAQAIATAITEALDRPYAFMGGPYPGRVGQTIAFDASGSYDPDGSIVQYGWDFDGDRTIDRTTAGPLTSYAYGAPFEGFATLTVTDDEGKSSLASSLVTVTTDGDNTPDSVDNCPSADNHGQEDEDGDGMGDVCDPEPGLFPPGPEDVYDGAPLTKPDSYATDQPSMTVAAPGVLGNDKGGGLTARIATGPTNGTVELKADGSFVYTPKPSFSGADTFTYAAIDGAGAQTVERVTVEVTRREPSPTTLQTSPLEVSGLLPAVFRFSATLKSAEQPMPGKVVRFTLITGRGCSATTDAAGTATCTTPLNLFDFLSLLGGYKATFDGDPSSAPATVAESRVCLAPYAGLRFCLK